MRQSFLALLLMVLLGIGGAGSPGLCEDTPNARVVINIPSRTLDYWEEGRRVKTYSVGVGRPGFPTPVGTYQVIRRVLNPGWEHPYRPQGRSRVPAGKANPLGTRWIGFHPHQGGEYGIHGTDRPASVGKLSSHGCVRMRIPDAEDLFERVQIGTPVWVTHERIRISVKDDGHWATLHPNAYSKSPDLKQELGRILQREIPHQPLKDDAEAALLRALQAGKPVLLEPYLEPSFETD